MQSYPPRRSGPRPNYTARRVVAAAGVSVVVLVIWMLVGRMTDGDDSSASPATTTTRPATTTMPLEPPPACEVPEESRQTAYARPEDWYRTLLDPIYAVPEQYEVTDLVPASEAGYSPEMRIRAFVAEDLGRLRNAILAEGLPEVALLAAHRSVDDQRALYDTRVVEMGEAATAEGTARPGHSEHHLGTTIDVRPIGATDVDQSFGETPTGQWLAEHSWEYGFVLSYPDGEQDVTCYKYEPWHFRYLGPELAGRVHASGLTLREYLWHWEKSGTEPGQSSAASPPPLPTSVPAATEGEDGGGG